MKILSRISAAIFLMLLVVQCDIATDESLTSPNSISPENVNPDYLLNSIQFNALNVYSTASSIGREMTRMSYMFGTTYQNAYSSQSFSGIYQDAYSDLFIDVQNLIPLAEERDLNFHIGVAKTLKAHAMLTMVDLFGDMPLEEALDPAIFNPGLTPGAAIYDSALVLLDEAIAEFETGTWTALPTNDMYYGEHPNPDEAWIKAANTIKLKAYLNTGNIQAINALETAGNLILDAEDDFTFFYSTNNVNPDSRHPLYIANYLNEASSYMAVNYMNMMLFDKSIVDPRMRYYFYRQQTSGPVSIQENPCYNTQPPTWYNTNDPYCTFPAPYDGYWGRDHLNDEGIPTDTDKRTVFGVYPVGGAFDTNQGLNAANDGVASYEGEGFRPILMSSFTHFMLAEANLRDSDPTAAVVHYEDGITASMRTVEAFGAPLAAGTAYEDLITNNLPVYITDALDNWNTQGEMRANSKEYYLALWTNGLEAYNLMRRTGYPNRSDNLQPAVDTNLPGTWYNTLLYPASMVDRNNNISQKSDNTGRTFWDTEAYTGRPADSFDF